MSARIRTAQPGDIDAVKALCDAHRRELGFVMRPSLEAAIAHHEVFVAGDADTALLGLVHFHHRRDAQITLYHLVVSLLARGQGYGRALIDALTAEGAQRGKSCILLKCPAELPANAFYSHIGFEQAGHETGKSRPLNVWRLPITTR